MTHHGHSDNCGKGPGYFLICYKKSARDPMWLAPANPPSACILPPSFLRRNIIISLPQTHEAHSHLRASADAVPSAQKFAWLLPSCHLLLHLNTTSCYII